MSGNSTDSGSDCIALAIAFFQAPSQFPELLRGEGRLPRGVNELLLVAAGNPRAASEKLLTPFVHPEKLRETAKFFIEQVLLAHHASHYRVFGVEPDASLAEIKDNHRLLMRLFHPDRQIAEADGATAIATRINQAYTDLRSPEARAAYDFSLQQKHATARKNPTSHPRPSHATAPSGRAFTLPLFVSRHLAPVVLGSFAFVAALGVALVYFNRVPASAPGTGEARKLKPEMALARPEPAAMPLEPPAQYLGQTSTRHPSRRPASRHGPAMRQRRRRRPTDSRCRPTTISNPGASQSGALPGATVGMPAKPGGRNDEAGANRGTVRSTRQGTKRSRHAPTPATREPIASPSAISSDLEACWRCRRRRAHRPGRQGTNPQRIWRPVPQFETRTMYIWTCPNPRSRAPTSSRASARPLAKYLLDRWLRMALTA